MRPDLRILNKIDVNYLLLTSKNKNSIVTPFWHKHRGYNDRFCIGSFNSIKYYANRLDYIYEFMNKEGSLHSERLVKFVINKFNIKNIDGNIFFCRVRANNTSASSDLKQYNKYKYKKKKKKNIIKNRK